MDTFGGCAALEIYAQNRNFRHDSAALGSRYLILVVLSEMSETLDSQTNELIACDEKDASNKKYIEEYQKCVSDYAKIVADKDNKIQKNLDDIGEIRKQLLVHRGIIV